MNFILSNIQIIISALVIGAAIGMILVSVCASGKCADLESEISGLKDELEDRENELKDTTAKLYAAERDSREKGTALITTQRENEILLKNRAADKERIADINNEAAIITKANYRLIDIVEELKEKVNELTERNDYLCNSNRQIREDNDSLSGQLTECTLIKNEQMQKNKALNEMYGELNKGVKAIKTEIPINVN